MSKQNEWKLVRNTWVSTKPVLPGVWRRKEGGHVVRARVTEAKTGKQKDLWRVLPEADAATALKWLEDERIRLRTGTTTSATSPSERFSVFASWLFEHKVTVREIRSAAGRRKWQNILEHLCKGTWGERAQRRVQGFGDLFVDRVEPSDVARWKEEVAVLISAGDFAPTTANDWLAVLRVIMKAARHKFGLPRLITEGVPSFDTTEHETYTEEEPNSLLPEEVGPFLARFREMHPAHFAMVYLGMITGLRPSSLRPLRRRGSESDVDWERSRIRVRRSQTVGDEVMRTTKQKRKYTIDLPEEAMEILRWHVDTQLRTPEQQDSDLLFPSVVGGFRAPCVLNKPLAEVAADLGLGKKVSQRALRRSFNDLARTARVDAIVTRSISGHLTEKMQDHYSTVNAAEQREGIAKVIRLVTPSRRSGEQGGEHAPQSGEHNEKAG